MDASGLLVTLRSRGFVLCWDGTKIKVNGPARVPDELASVLRAQRQQVIELLKGGGQAPKPSGPVVRIPGPERIAPVKPCRACGAGRLWRLPEVTTWWCAACLPCCLPADEVAWADAPEAGVGLPKGTPARSPVASIDAEAAHG